MGPQVSGTESGMESHDKINIPITRLRRIA